MGKIILGAILGVGALIVGIAVIGIVSSDRGAANNSNAVGTFSTRPAISVIAPKLWADYQAIEVAADNQYRGKRLVVRGIVSSINKDITDDVYVALSTPNEFEQVHANLRIEYQQVAANLQIGQVLAVECEGGGMILGSPVLKDCSILPSALPTQAESESQRGADQQQAELPPSAGTEITDNQAIPSTVSQAPEPTSNFVRLPVLIYQAPAVYPEEARSQRVEGTVQVVLNVDENGTPQNVTVARSVEAGLDEAAVEAVKQYKFKPAVDENTGRNVPAQISMNVQFRLN